MRLHFFLISHIVIYFYYYHNILNYAVFPLKIKKFCKVCFFYVLSSTEFDLDTSASFSNISKTLHLKIAMNPFN